MDEGLLPKNYKPVLTRRQVPVVSEEVKDFIETRLKKDMKLFKHVAPMCFMAGTGVNDDLDGTLANKPVGFHVANITRDRGVVSNSEEEERFGFDAEVVESLAKWKRMMLQWYECPNNTGLFCESTSIRKGYKGDVTHSNICDQWDWEMVITREQRTVEFLKSTVRTIWRFIKDCETMLHEKYPVLKPFLPEDITFVTAEELHSTWPLEDIHGRENKAVEKWGAIFIIGMGYEMKDGSAPEEVRAPDYDDWNLNGDIIVRHPVTGYRHELSSMGIRVDADSLRKQLEHRGMEDRAKLAFHKKILDDELPLCIGGGIGISRMLMLLLQRGHIGEVQVGIWHSEHFKQAEQHGISLIPDRII